jgi:hypothetical protein
VCQVQLSKCFSYVRCKQTGNIGIVTQDGRFLCVWFCIKRPHIAAHDKACTTCDGLVEFVFKAQLSTAQHVDAQILQCMKYVWEDEEQQGFFYDTRPPNYMKTKLKGSIQLE